MLRVLMVLEDYGELMFLQTVLKKLGFDVDAIQNPRSFADHVLTMNPDVLVMTANGKKVQGIELSRTLRRVRGQPRVILLRQSSVPEDAQALADGWLETPVSALALLNLLADICGLNKQVLAEKFQKLRMQEIEEEKARVLKMIDSEEATLNRTEAPNGNFGTLGTSSIPQAERNERYKKYLEEKPPKEHSFATKAVIEQVRNLRQQESTADLADLERERKLFVEHLFKKKA
jgi:CheY-like chemotaxis protein